MFVGITIAHRDLKSSKIEEIDLPAKLSDYFYEVTTAISINHSHKFVLNEVAAGTRIVECVYIIACANGMPGPTLDAVSPAGEALPVRKRSWLGCDATSWWAEFVHFWPLPWGRGGLRAILPGRLACCSHILPRGLLCCSYIVPLHACLLLDFHIALPFLFVVLRVLALCTPCAVRSSVARPLRPTISTTPHASQQVTCTHVNRRKVAQAASR